MCIYFIWLERVEQEVESYLEKDNLKKAFYERHKT